MKINIKLNSIVGKNWMNKPVLSLPKREKNEILSTSKKVSEFSLKIWQSFWQNRVGSTFLVQWLYKNSLPYWYLKWAWKWIFLLIFSHLKKNVFTMSLKSLLLLIFLNVYKSCDIKLQLMKKHCCAFLYKIKVLVEFYFMFKKKT